MQTGKLILIVGGSSAGKSTLINELQNQLLLQKQKMFHEHGFDQMLYAFPKAFFPIDFDNPDSCTEAYVSGEWREIDGEQHPYYIWREKLTQHFRGYLAATQAILEHGSNVIADMVVWNDTMKQAIDAAFSHIPHVSIYAYAKPEVLKQREHERGDRIANLCYSTAAVSKQHFPCDYILETSSHSPEALATQLLQQLGEWIDDAP